MHIKCNHMVINYNKSHNTQLADIYTFGFSDHFMPGIM